MPGSATSVSAELASFAERNAWDMLPEAVRHEAKRALLNVLGCALGVARSHRIDQAVAVHRQFSGPPQATLIGRAERLDMLGASFVNAVGGQLPRLRRHPPQHRDSSERAGRAARAGPWRSHAHLRRGGAHGLRARGGSRLPHRQRRVARPLRARLAHHLDLRGVRRGSRERQAARPACASRSPMRSASRRARRRGSSRTCRAAPRTSASATRPATGYSRP